MMETLVFTKNQGEVKWEEPKNIPYPRKVTLYCSKDEFTETYTFERIDADFYSLFDDIKNGDIKFLCVIYDQSDGTTRFTSCAYDFAYVEDGESTLKIYPEATRDTCYFSTYNGEWEVIYNS